jgi:GNAT superfamily N-acetyltransferase
MAKVEIIRGYAPGAIGRVAELHAAYYAREWAFGVFFEARVASELAEFLLRCDDTHDGFWTARLGDSMEGAIAIDGLHATEEGSHLRWFIVSDALRGQGAGARLLTTALDFCRTAGHRRVYLNTFEGLHAARRLYEQAGFRLIEQRRGAQWGRELLEQRFELDLTQQG